MAKQVSAMELENMVGEEVALSDWFQVDQKQIDAFAEATGDHQWIHVKPEMAANTPWGSTVAHGYLTLSLLPKLLGETGVAPEGTMMAINYGSDRVRFINPVKVGSSVRARSVLSEVEQTEPGRWLFITKVTMEIEGEERPAMVAEILTLYFTQPT